MVGLCDLTGKPVPKVRVHALYVQYGNSDPIPQFYLRGISVYPLTVLCRVGNRALVITDQV